MNQYKKYLTDNGGASNAGTSPDKTVYYFTIKNSKLKKGLEIFSKFFIEPLFSPDGIEKEINAVNSESTGNMNNEARRQ